MSFIYAMAQPNNLKETYSPFENIDFNISYSGYDMVANSVRFLADLVCTNNASGDLVLIDEFAGGHATVDQISTSTELLGNIETIPNYPRYVSMLGRATQNRDDLINSRHVCELKAPSQTVMNAVLKDTVVCPDSDPAVSGTFTMNPDFSAKLNFCLNNVEGDDIIPYEKTGDIQIKIRLSRNEDLFHGRDSTNTTYVLKNVRLSYFLKPASGRKDTKHLLKVKSSFNQAMSSNFTSISSKVAGVCSGVSISFMETSRIGSKQYNNCQQMQLPNVSSLQFLFNDTENKLITYEITDNTEMIEKYLESFKNVSNNQASLQYLEANNSYGLGVSFNGLVDLSNQKFTTQIQSDVNSTNPYTAFLYFHNLLEL